MGYCPTYSILLGGEGVLTPERPPLRNGLDIAGPAVVDRRYNEDGGLRVQYRVVPVLQNTGACARVVPMDVPRSVLAGLSLCAALNSWAGDLRLSDDEPLELSAPGSYQLRALTSTVLELTYVTAKQPGRSSTSPWDFIEGSGQIHLPSVKDFTVLAGQKVIPVQTVGFKRRVLYAPLKKWDLRVANCLYLALAAPVPEGENIEVRNPGNRLWTAKIHFTCQQDRNRWSPAIHVNQTGYLPNYPKQAMVGYYLGSLGELELEKSLAGPGETNSQPRPAVGLTFKIVEAASLKPVYEGPLRSRPDRGFPFDCYQRVYEADFTECKKPGQYLLWVPGLGRSYPFVIGEDVAGAFARAYALGIYHQRCGTDNSLPYTRFTHGPCHTARAEVPDLSSRFEFINQCLEKMTTGCKENPRHTAPQLKNVGASLYPFVNRGPVDVRGGHHDAGDYSKYTINSAAFIHHLVFAADVFQGVSSLDNLGLPESGDGKSDVLQEAKWEADFLVKMQDADGGFYFLVYPREREYENDVLPDRSDPQVVFPKSTSVTAAAIAALAECASSPAFKRQFPEAAKQYLVAAWKGWDFLEKAIDKFGKDGAYQKITHYGDEFMHDDELAWAACELFLASGNERCHKRVMEWLKPADPGTRRWGWWRLYDSYGCAIRSYAFGARSGRLQRDQLNQLLLEECENEIAAAGEDQLRRAQDCAYGTSFPVEAKRTLNAGWYFSSDAGFDLAVACQLDYPVSRDPREKMKAAIMSNLNYEEGCNPLNVAYLTGLGWHRQREIVDQYALNDRRVLPPTGIPLGNVQAGFGWNYVYQTELGALSFPSDSGNQSAYPFYDRWGDAFNLSQEFVIVNQARALGYLAWLMAQTPLKDQRWKAGSAKIVDVSPTSGSPGGTNVKLAGPDVDMPATRIVWEAEGQEPYMGPQFRFKPGSEGCRWIEAEAQLPDGRRIFATRERPTDIRTGR